MNKKRIFLILMSIYVVMVGIFYWVAEKRINYSTLEQTTGMLSGDTVGGIYGNHVIKKDFIFDGDWIKTITVKVGTYNRINQGDLEVELFDDAENRLWSQTIKLSKLKDNYNLSFEIDRLVEKNSRLELCFSSSAQDEENAITFYSAQESDTMALQEKQGKNIFIKISGGIGRQYGKVFWLIAFLGGVLLAIMIFYTQEAIRKNKNNWITAFIIGCKKYKFLLNQLVLREFKTKYKRSVLGFLWSFLNPLLTMAVQYIVFSTIFRADIENFPVYLLSASIMFNFFTESVGSGLNSIVGNASLINKVYMPKYIYPLSKVLSAAINLFISNIPLMVALLLTHERITKAFFVIPFIFICIIGFCVGMSLMLSTSMVFFRDTQFLWGIVSLLWMYATPLFYPESIIPPRFGFVLKVNPMYHYIKFFRTILLSGESPLLSEYAICVGFSAMTLFVGYKIFKHYENRFVLYL